MIDCRCNLAAMSYRSPLRMERLSNVPDGLRKDSIRERFLPAIRLTRQLPDRGCDLWLRAIRVMAPAGTAGQTSTSMGRPENLATGCKAALDELGAKEVRISTENLWRE